MVHILGLSGSLRSGSYNSALLRAAADVIASGIIGSEATLEIGSIRGIPLYDGDVEAAEGIPVVVQALKARVQACDGLLLNSLGMAVIFTGTKALFFLSEL